MNKHMAINIAEAALRLARSLPHYQCLAGRLNQCAVNAFRGSRGGQSVVISILLHISVCWTPGNCQPPPEAGHPTSGSMSRLDPKREIFFFYLFIYKYIYFFCFFFARTKSILSSACARGQMHNVNTVTVNRKAVIHNTACACMWWDFFSGEVTCYATTSFYSCFTLVRVTLHIGVCKWRQSGAADRPARSGRNKSMIFFRFLKQD